MVAQRLNHKVVHHSIVYNSEELETTQMAHNKRLVKSIVVICVVDYLCKKKKISKNQGKIKSYLSGR